MPHVLIVGGESTIGAALATRLLAEGYQVTCTTRRRATNGAHSLYLDLHKPDSFSSLLHCDYDTAVICGAITSIQQCEQSPELTRQVNVDGILAVANLLRHSRSHVVFLSTNMVFDGSKSHFRSSDIRCPNTEYGRQKSMVEEALLTSKQQACILRLGKVIPSGFPLFNKWLRSLKSGLPIHPYNDSKIAPVSLELASSILLWVISSKHLGILQATASHDITYANAAFRLAHLVRADPGLIQPINASLFNSGVGIRASNPGYTSLEFSQELKPTFAAPSPHEAVSYAIPNSPQKLNYPSLS